jgi:hypothetical protein
MFELEDEFQNKSVNIILEINLYGELEEYLYFLLREIIFNEFRIIETEINNF